MNSSLAARTLARATAALQSNPIASLPEIVRLMRRLSGDSGQVSVGELAEVIQMDAAILTKVLGVANTLGYNPGGVPVTTVTQAVHVIGFERIRSLAMALLLIERTSRHQTGEEQREACALALTSGCLAQTAAASRMRLDPEQAFVCAALRNYGRIVMAGCMRDDYRDAQQRATGCPDDEAYREVFGLTPLELGRELLKAANLPEDMLNAVRELPPGALTVLDRHPEAQMMALVDFSSKLARLALQPEAAPGAFATQAAELCARFKLVLPDLAADLPHLVGSASRQIDHLVRVCKLRGMPLQSLSRLRARSTALDPANRVIPAPVAPEVLAVADPPLIAAGAALASVAGPEPAVVCASLAGLPGDFSGGWSAKISQVADLLRQPSGSCEAVFGVVAQAVCHGMRTGECLVFSVRSGQPGFPLTHGHGRMFAALRATARVQAGDRTVFGVCLERRENILIHHARDPKILPYLPAWLREASGLGAFALLPLTDGKTAHGVVLAGWAEARQIALSSDEVRQIRALLALATFHCRRRAA